MANTAPVLGKLLVKRGVLTALDQINEHRLAHKRQLLDHLAHTFR